MNATLEAPRRFKTVVDEWNSSFTKALHRPHTQKEYEDLCEFSYIISESLEEKHDKDMQALLDIVVLLIDQYQTEHCSYDDADPVSVLRTLMADHGLVQNDLKE
ncbi:MAG: hypothetical protein HQL32_05980, partial [Planctomycetes bacterium]|nr:hypothetical protein [Planctomycetota bacterium]